MSKEEKEVIYCASYGRSSDDDTFKKKHNSGEQQGHICRVLAESQSLRKGVEHRIVYELIEEKAVSGGTSNRPKYKELLSLIEKRRIKAIFAKELSRISRNLGDFCKLLELCKKHEVSIYMKGLEYEHGNAFSDMVVKLFAVIAEFERQIIIERTKSSIRSRTKNNAIIHGGRVALGFDKVEGKTGVWKKNTKELKIVKHLMEIFLETGSYVDTYRKAHELGYKTKTGVKFNKDSLRRVLKNEKYIGKLKVPNDGNEEDEFVDLPTGVAIGLELFKKVQEKILSISEGERYQRKGAKRTYPFSGLLVDEKGHSFIGGLGGGKAYYISKGKEKKGFCG